MTKRKGKSKTRSELLRGWIAEDTAKMNQHKLWAQLDRNAGKLHRAAFHERQAKSYEDRITADTAFAITLEANEAYENQ